MNKPLRTSLLVAATLALVGAAHAQTPRQLAQAAPAASAPGAGPQAQGEGNAPPCKVLEQLAQADPLAPPFIAAPSTAPKGALSGSAEAKPCFVWRRLA